MASSRLSHVSPNFRDAKPTPPPCASPAMQTVGHEPAGTVTSVARQPVVDVDQPRAGADDRMPGRVEPHRVQPRHVDDDARGGGVAAVAVAAGARHDPDRVLARPAHGALHVRKRLAEHDRARADPVEARVEEQTRLVVVGGAANDDVALEHVRELVEDPGPGRGGELDQTSGKRDHPAASATRPPRDSSSPRVSRSMARI